MEGRKFQFANKFHLAQLQEIVTT